MKQAKIFIAFIFLLAFAVCISAQEEKFNIVWENLREKYTSFAEIKPQIKNVSDNNIYLYPNYYLQVFVFSEERKEWDFSKYHFITDYVGWKPPKPKAVKLESNQSYNLSEWIYWNYQLLGENGSFQKPNKPDWERMLDYKSGRKYKSFFNKNGPKKLWTVCFLDA